MDHWNAQTPPEQAGDELAACLARFLDARVDEGTMERAWAALARWQQLVAQEWAGGGVR